MLTLWWWCDFPKIATFANPAQCHTLSPGHIKERLWKKKKNALIFHCHLDPAANGQAVNFIYEFIDNRTSYYVLIFWISDEWWLMTFLNSDNSDGCPWIFHEYSCFGRFWKCSTPDDIAHPPLKLWTWIKLPENAKHWSTKCHISLNPISP